jgi:hypothetical protein
MPIMDDAKTLTQFECDVLEWLLRGDDPMRKALREQIMAASVSGRQFTGVGFYVDFVVPDDVPRLDESLGTKPDFAFGNVGALFEDANVEVGFVLFVRGGRVQMLEGYTYGDESWPEPEGKYRLFYFGEPGTLSGGARRDSARE